MADLSAAAGRVVTGFSKPYVALYSNTSGTNTYTSGQVLARGVDVSLSPESSSDNIFYADNTTAETDAGSFTGGTVSFTVDGLLTAAEKLIMGLPSEDTDGWMAYDDDQKVPYCGVGWIARYVSGGVVSYVPTVLCKVAFEQVENAAATQEDSIDYQTQSLTANLYRSDDAKHSWKYVGKEFATEALAEAALKTKLGITA